MSSQFLGIDIAGSKNTWMALLEDHDSGLRLKTQPSIVTIQKIIDQCSEGLISSVAIDAQLSLSPADERGFRPEDEKLKSLLPAECRNWVASFNSLMAVPVRGRLLAEAIAPIVGTILETHPRASLLLALGDDRRQSTMEYKKRTKESLSSYRERGGPQFAGRLWKAWCDKYRIVARPPGEVTDGEVDALVCATIGVLFHREPRKLMRLTGANRQAMGRGPFYVAR